MRKFEVTTHEDDYIIEAHYMKVIKNNNEDPTHIVFTKLNECGASPSTAAIFNFASVVSVVDITNRPEAASNNLTIRRFSSQATGYMRGLDDGIR